METIEEDIDSYIESKDKITKFGSIFDRFGSNAITIRSIPAFFEQTINTTTFRMIFDDIVSDKIDSIEN
jgi:DNA mismatch repair ATPase MutL